MISELTNRVLAAAGRCRHHWQFAYIREQVQSVDGGFTVSKPGLECRYCGATVAVTDLRDQQEVSTGDRA